MPENNTSPFTSRGYPFNKDMSSYDAYSLGRAFFADELVDSYGSMHFFDQMAVFEKLKIQVSDEPYYYQQQAIPVYIYTTNNQEEFEDKYKRLDAKANEMGVFGLVKEGSIAFSPKIGSGLQHLLQNSQANNNPSYFVEVANEKIASVNISAKWFIDLFATNGQPLFNALNVATKQQIEDDIETIVGKPAEVKSYIKNKPVRPKTVNITVGVFFDGTGNNRYCSELIYYQCLRDAPTELDDLKVKKILDLEKKAKVKDGVFLDSKVAIKNPQTGSIYTDIKELAKLIEDDASSYLNPYSNIVLLHDLYRTNTYNPNKSNQQNIYLKQYVQGIGTLVDLDDSGIPIKYYEDDIIGSAAGKGNRGVSGRVETGIKYIVKQIKKVLTDNNVTINSITFDCFGFSRGAAAARHFANEVLKPEEKSFNEIYEELEDGAVAIHPTRVPIIIPRGGYLGKKLDENDISVPKDIEVRYIGLFDTVLSDIFKQKPIVGYFMTLYQSFKDFGEQTSMPHTIYEKGEKINLSLKNTDAYVNHIVAMNEYRNNFPLTISDAKNQFVLPLYGAHSDIGGGYAETYYDTILEFRDIHNEGELQQFEKVATSYKNRFARVKKNDGLWGYKEGQIEVKKYEEHYAGDPSSIILSRSIPPAKLSDHYQIIDHRFISNKLSLVALHAMLTSAISRGVPFIKEYSSLPKDDITGLSKEELYAIPQVDCLQDYHKGVQEIVANGKKEYWPTPEEFYFLYKNYVHLSANYNEAKGGFLGGKGVEVISMDLYVNLPTEDKKRVIYPPE